MKFLIDMQLPPRLTQYFQAKGCDAVHTTAYPQGHLMNDQTIGKIAVEEARIIVTKDADFYDHFFIDGNPPVILLLEVGNTSNKELIEILEKHFAAILQFLNKNSGLVICSKNDVVCY